MSPRPASGSPASGGLLRTIRSWMQAWSAEPYPSLDDAMIEARGPDAHSFGAVQVLVVDDNPVNLMVISALLESRGIVPTLAADGAEAVALACELHFDLILMDLQMPILDGLGATSLIRRFEGSSMRPAVPVISYSSHAPGAGALALHGFNGSLSKPCEDRDLEECLARWCPTYRPAPPASGAAYRFRFSKEPIR